jgi:hypothetical protein
MKKLILLFILTTVSCKGILAKNNEIQKNINAKYRCEIPKEIQEYMQNHENDFAYIDIDKEMNLLKEFSLKNDCPVTSRGDFNNNGKEDFAIILRYSVYKNPNYKNYKFPFLVIFNDYKEKIEPTIIYKTGNYQNEDIKTVIYEQFEDGIYSYINTENLFDKDVIEIIIPEKSIFYVYWDNNEKKYSYVNSLDFDELYKMQDEDVYTIPNTYFVYDSTFIQTNYSNYKIISIEKKKEKDNLAGWHFNLPIVVLKERKKGSEYYKLYENSKLVFGKGNDCPADGYIGVIAKGFYFTIEQVFCSDLIFVRSFTTFKINEVTNQVKLHKFGERYTDRSNPDRKILDKIWTTKDFGEVKFENVTEDFLVKLRQTKPKNKAILDR